MKHTRRGRTLAAALLALALCVGLLPAAALAAENVDYIYYEWNETTQTLSEPKSGNVTSATEVTTNTTTWNSGWYVAQDEVTINDRVTVTGNVHLILQDNCTLTVNGGINVAEGNSLTIYGQSEGENAGTLVAINSSTAAGIGGGNVGNGGEITIYGGTIEASGSNGAGIGGGNVGAGGTVTITGGTVTATGGRAGGAGIGGGWNGAAGTFSTGNNGHAVIFASSIQDEEETSNPWRGVIFEGNSGQVYGTSITPTEDFKIEAGKTLTIETGKTLVIQEGVTLTNNGTIDVYGALNGEVIGGTVNYKVTGVSLSPETLTLEAGDSTTLTATVQPDNADDKTVTWTTSDPSVATVDANGNVTAVGAGTATITATAADGSGEKATCAVTVTAPYIPPVPSYLITIADSEDGAVTSSHIAAVAGATVTLTVTPEEGYELAALTVTDFWGREVALTANGDGTYTFPMPASQVEVAAVFTQAEKPELPFLDVTEADWFYDEVYYVWESGLMQGTGETSFGPNLATTRAQVVTILYRLEGEPAVTGDNPFTDAQVSWYADAVLWASQKGIVNGYTDTVFGAEDAITREQLAAILYRYAQYKGYDLTAAGDLSGFADANAVSVWAEEALSWAVGEKLIQGSANQIDPAGAAIRAQLAAILTRFCQGAAG